MFGCTRAAARCVCGVLFTYGLCFNTAQLCGAEVPFDTRALTGGAAPGTAPGVVFSGFNPAAINAAGQTAFRGRVIGPGVDTTNDVGIWSGDDVAQRLVARTGNAAPGTGTGVQFSFIRSPLINAAGQAAFSGYLSGTGVEPFVNHAGIWSETGGSLHLVARTGDVAPGTSGGVYSDFGTSDLIANDDDPFVLNAAGQTAFRATLRTGVGGVNPTNNSGIWSEAGGSLGLVVREGDQAPDTEPGVGFRGFTSNTSFEPVMNGNGQTAFEVLVAGPPDHGIWSVGGGANRLVVGIGDAAPGTGSRVTFSGLVSRPFSINDAGQVAFRASIGGPGVISANSSGIWSERGGALVLVARAGDPAPGTGPDVVFRAPMSSPIFFNGNGQTAFFASLMGPGINSTNDRGIWSNVDGTLGLAARRGDAAPGTTAVFDDFNDVEFNGARQIAFISSLTGTGVMGANDTGLWVRGPNGTLTLILREGDLFDVNDAPVLEDLRTISTIDLSETFRGSGGEDGQRSGFNEAGQLVFLLEFTDGSEGIFVATIGAPIPEPTALQLAIVAAVGAALSGRERFRF